MPDTTTERAEGLVYEIIGEYIVQGADGRQTMIRAAEAALAAHAAAESKTPLTAFREAERARREIHDLLDALGAANERLGVVERERDEHERVGLDWAQQAQVFAKRAEAAEARAARLEAALRAAHEASRLVGDPSSRLAASIRLAHVRQVVEAALSDAPEAQP